MITQFMDMHSGGGTKERPYEYIYIEAPRQEAISVFYARFGHNPERVSCTCCGDDYSIEEFDTLEEATEYERKGYKGTGKTTVSEYLQQDDILFIPAEVIDEGSRHRHVPQEGFVWL